MPGLDDLYEHQRGGQKNPLIECKNEDYDMILEMMTQMRRNVIYSMFTFQPAPQGATA